MSEQTIREKLIEICTELVKGCKEEFCSNCKYNDNAYPRCRGIHVAGHLLANGVIVPPCKVGDKIYQTDGVRIYESTVEEVDYTANKVIYVTENICFDETAIGKSVFLTKEEAEKALKERSEGK